ncbi:MAG: hypothetical protein AB7U29_03615 [Desulfobulbus sp.]
MAFKQTINDRKKANKVNEKNINDNMSDEDVYELVKIKISKEIKDEVVSWIKRDFRNYICLLSIVMLIIGIVTVNPILNSLLEDQISSAKDTISKMAIELSVSSKVAMVEIEKFSKKFNESNNDFEKLERDYKKINDDIGKNKISIESEISHSAKYAEENLNHLNEKFKELEKLVVSITDKSKRQQELISNYEKRLSKIDEKQTIKNYDFKENSQVKITVYMSEGVGGDEFAHAIISNLKSAGFRVVSSIRSDLNTKNIKDQKLEIYAKEGMQFMVKTMYEKYFLPEFSSKKKFIGAAMYYVSDNYKLEGGDVLIKFL